MQTLSSYQEVGVEQGFQVYRFMNERLEVAVVPELGAKIISLKNRRTGREWLWRPHAEVKLFRNHLGDDFSRSPLAGVDECLPTVAPCWVNGRSLPDHGEVWSTAWQVDHAAWDQGVLKTSVNLVISPLTFERTLEVREERVQLSYVLRNRSLKEERYLWALHPLLRVRPGDRLEMPSHTRALFNGASWIDAVDSAVPEGGYEKVFAGPLNEGLAAVRNQETCDRLSFQWNPSENDTLGLWLTRGGWNGHHHLAIEPANGAPDLLAQAVEDLRCGVMPAAGTRTWSVTLRIEP